MTEEQKWFYKNKWVYYKKQYMDENEIVNGFKLYNFAYDYQTYLEILELWLQDKYYTPYIEPLYSKDCQPSNHGPCTGTNYPKGSFEDECDKIMCSDWNKQDVHGECYEGYWKYDKNTFEYKKAYDLSREYGIYRLSCLPYPKSVLLYTIQMGCANRLESVRFSNSVCEWMCRKYYQTDKHLPLVNGNPKPLNEKEFIVKKKYKPISYLNNQLSILVKIPQYIKMEILEPHTELSFWHLYNL